MVISTNDYALHDLQLLIANSSSHNEYSAMLNSLSQNPPHLYIFSTRSPHLTLGSLLDTDSSFRSSGAEACSRGRSVEPGRIVLHVLLVSSHLSKPWPCPSDQPIKAYHIQREHHLDHFASRQKGRQNDNHLPILSFFGVKNVLFCQVYELKVVNESHRWYLFHELAHCILHLPLQD